LAAFGRIDQDQLARLPGMVARRDRRHFLASGHAAGM
jgi:hypothetical protein